MARDPGPKVGNRVLSLLLLGAVAASAAPPEGALSTRPGRNASPVATEATGAEHSAPARVARRRTEAAEAVVTDAVAGGEVFSYGRASSGPAAGSSPAAVAETPVAVDVAALATSDLVPVELTLPDGQRYRAVPEEIAARGPLSLLWRGRLVGNDGEEGEGVITVHDGHVAGLLTLPGRLLELVPEAEAGRARLLEIESSLFPPCGGGVASPEPLPRVAAVPQAQEGPIWIDVLVLYTPKARRAAGGQAQIETAVQAAVDVTNDAYANSRVTQRLYLAHTAEVSYDETGIPMERTLDWLRTNAAVAAMRRTYGADTVALIAESPDLCGIGYVMRDVSPAFESLAFSVTHRPCAVGIRTLAHELGHNMGLEHDPLNGPPPEEASYPWSFGHFVEHQFLTVMSYPDFCGAGCQRVGYFSNPGVRYRGFPTGIAQRRHNARTLDLTGPVVEDFRVGLSDPPDDFTVTVSQDRGVLVARAVYSLRWSSHPLAVGYHVYRTQGGGLPSRITGTPISETSYVETGPIGEEGRGYAVSAVLANGAETRRTQVLFGGEAP